MITHTQETTVSKKNKKAFNRTVFKCLRLRGYSLRSSADSPFNPNPNPCRFHQALTFKIRAFKSRINFSDIEHHKLFYTISPNQPAFLLFVCLFCLQDRVSLHNPGWPGTSSLDQVASASQVLRLKAYTTTPSLPTNF